VSAHREMSTSASASLAAQPAARPRLRARHLQDRLGPRSGLGALGVITLLTLVFVLDATAGPSILVPRSGFVYPGWEAGPLHRLIPQLLGNRIALQDALTAALLVLLGAWMVVLGAIGSLSRRAIWTVVIALHVILLLGPPTQLTDLFNYLGFARLGTLHHLNPYTHPISAETYDPVFLLSSWHDLRSPYGELFTIISYPLGLLSLSAAYWIVKIVTVALSLCFLWLIERCALRLNVDPRRAVAYVALNPIFIIYAVGGFHNDFFMLVPMMAALLLVLTGRERAAGACLMAAIAVKFTAVILLPFLLVALPTWPRRRRLMEGVVIALVPIAAASLALFGTSPPNLSQQSTLLTNFSGPNLLGLIFGVGGSPTVLHVATGLLVAVIAYQLVRRRERWLEGAGWSTVALILSLSWVVPWYVVWMLPFAVLGRSAGLRRASVVLTLWMLLTFAPTTTQLMNDHNVSLLTITKAGRSALALQHRLAY
jgi:alpha-1,6-mannosyltransferase